MALYVIRRQRMTGIHSSRRMERDYMVSSGQYSPDKMDAMVFDQEEIENAVYNERLRNHSQPQVLSTIKVLL